MKAWILCLCLTVLLGSSLALTPVPDTSACSEQKLPGPCRGFYPRFYFDNDAMECKDFVYGGCDGNRNNFLTLENCDDICQS